MGDGFSSRAKDKQLRKFVQLASSFEEILAKDLGAEAAGEIKAESLRVFRAVLPQAPTFPGGPLNPFNRIAAGASQMIAIYTAMRARGLPVEKTALLFYDHYAEMHEKIPQSIRRLTSRFIFSPLFIMIMKFLGRQMTAQNDPDGFDIRYERGDGIQCDWYFSARRCGMVRFMQKQGCAELARYCNMLDYIQGCTFNMGVRFKRCIGTGDPVCVECMKKGRTTEIPPLVAELLHGRRESKGENTP